MVQSVLADFFAKARGVNLSMVTPPAEKVSKNDKVIGILSDDLKKLYAIYAIFVDSVARQKAGLNDLIARVVNKEESVTDEDRENVQNYFITKAQLNICRDVFWNAVNEELPETAIARRIALREDWQVVTVEDDMPECCKMCASSLSTGFGMGIVIMESVRRPRSGFPQNPGA